MADPDTVEPPAAPRGGSGWRLDHQIPPALVVALVLQSAAALLWAGGAAERIAVIEQRLDRQAGVAERLARLEAEGDNARAALARIEAKLDRSTGR